MYFYAVGVIYSLLVWALLFTFARKVRKEILVSSVAWAHTGPILEYWHHQDYWNPNYLFPVRFGGWVFGAEDYLFAFCYAGFTTGVFHLFLRVTQSPPSPRRALKHFVRLQFAGAAFLILLTSLIALTDWNSVTALVMLSVAISASIFWKYPRWLPAALWTAAATGCAALLSYWGFFFRLYPEVLDDWWQLDRMSGLSILGVPLEEIVWAAGLALFVGPVYRATMPKP